MFGTHVKKDLSAYAHGELAPERSQRVCEHLRSCAACREEYEEMKLGIRLAECLPQAEAPAALWDGIEAGLARDAFKGKADETKARRAGFRFPALSWRAGLSFATVLLLAGAGWLYYRATRPAWEVASIEGEASIAGRVGERGRLGVGQWLETGPDARARVEVANIGQVEVEENTRIRLVETRLTEHRLELERGTLHARIYAPPRLFFVDTPSAVAADLGCAYTLEVDDAGRGLLHVTSGWVALEKGERESVVPAGAACLTKPGAGPGTPFFEDAPEEFTDALTRLDFEGGGREALEAVLSSSRPRDTLTLWHLLARVGEADRGRVYERLASLAPPPEGVTRERITSLDADALAAWKEQLEITWSSESFPKLRRTLRKLLK
ncbi:MAG TPA: zf-HC2 domain-containing protein [Pyrinomonadaceae bacterium]|jgi:anti-sigma factor ChrR (cupin superfamily)|nr:zf-HC2 domain-containing protein [Pyrinomonadaceae bacterium]